ncbi:MAG: hypothetical protein HDT14_12955 [Oscillibacter sp.]|nr:hypothetical protein [Oscillibacter sp.]
MKHKSFFRHSSKSTPTDYSKFDPPASKSSLILDVSSARLRWQIIAASSFSEFWERHKKQIVHQPLSEYLCMLLDKKGLKRSDVVTANAQAVRPPRVVAQG